MLEEKLTITEQQALDIAENPADITPEQLDALLSDADLRRWRACARRCVRHAARQIQKNG